MGSAIPFFLLVETFPGYARNPFEKRQAAVCPFSKGFRANPGNVSINRKEGTKIQKRIVHPLIIFKRFW
jgi:hypothetical protein